MRYLIAFLALFLTTTSMCQKRIEPTPYQKHMTEVAQSKMHYHITVAAAKSRIHAYRPYSWVKITFKTSMNTSIISKIRIAEMVEMMENDDSSLGEIIDVGLSDLEVDDYMSIMAYDIRAKIYLPHHSSVVLRCFVTGIQLNTYNYTLGYSYKF
jgi:hypothetical protein